MNSEKFIGTLCKFDGITEIDLVALIINVFHDDLNIGFI